MHFNEACAARTEFGERLIVDTGGREIVTFNVDEEFVAIANYCVYAGGLIQEGKLSGTVSASSTSGSTTGSPRVKSWLAPDTAGSSTSLPGNTSRARHTAAYLRRERLGRARLRRNRRVRERGVNRGWRTVTVTGRAVESGDVSDGVDGRDRGDDGFEAARCRHKATSRPPSRFPLALGRIGLVPRPVQPLAIRAAAVAGRHPAPGGRFGLEGRPRCRGNVR